MEMLRLEFEWIRRSNLECLRMCVVDCVVHFVCAWHCIACNGENWKRAFNVCIKDDPKRRTNWQKKPCSRISIVYPFICTTVTNYWLKFFGIFFYSLSLSLSSSLAMFILFPCREKSARIKWKKKEEKSQNSFTIGFEYTSPPKHFQYLAKNSTWYSECVHKLKWHTLFVRMSIRCGWLYFSRIYLRNLGF